MPTLSQRGGNEMIEILNAMKAFLKMKEAAK
jgi:hypothetical protein